MSIITRFRGQIASCWHGLAYRAAVPESVAVAGSESVAGADATALSSRSLIVIFERDPIILEELWGELHPSMSGQNRA